MSGPKTLSGGQDSAEKSRIWCNNAEFALFKGTTSLNRLSQHPYLAVPWQILATDLFELKGADYLIVINYFSRYVEVAAMQETTKSSEVIRALKSIFARHGIPEQVRSDNGPKFDSAEFSYFAKEWGFKQSTSSPRFPQANGEVERGVRTVKNLLTKEKDPAKALLAYRSTPLACKFSPAQLLMGRRIRNSIPLFHTS